MRTALVLAGALLVWSVDPIRPGDDRVDPSGIVASDDTLAAILIPEDGVAQLLGTVVLRTGRTGDDQIWRSEHMTLLGEATSVDSFTVDARTLAPTYREAGGQLRTDRGEAFHANAIDLVLAALPLADGFEAELAMESEGADAESSARVRVLGSESVPTVSGATCDAWKVEVDQGGMRGLYWIDRRSGVLAQFMAPAEGFVLGRVRAC